MSSSEEETGRTPGHQLVPAATVIRTAPLPASAITAVIITKGMTAAIHSAAVVIAGAPPAEATPLTTLATTTTVAMGAETTSTEGATTVLATVVMDTATAMPEAAEAASSRPQQP